MLSESDCRSLSSEWEVMKMESGKREHCFLFLNKIFTLEQFSIYSKPADSTEFSRTPHLVFLIVKILY